jgi:hypothetical protein
MNTEKYVLRMVHVKEMFNMDTNTNIKNFQNLWILDEGIKNYARSNYIGMADQDELLGEPITINVWSLVISLD